MVAVTAVAEVLDRFSLSLTVVVEAWLWDPVDRTSSPASSLLATVTDSGPANCAFVAGSDTRSFSLSARASVFSTKLLAIDTAVCFIEVCNGVSYVILTVSLSSLLA